MADGQTECRYDRLTAGRVAPWPLVARRSCVVQVSWLAVRFATLLAHRLAGRHTHKLPYQNTKHDQHDNIKQQSHSAFVVFSLGSFDGLRRLDFRDDGFRIYQGSHPHHYDCSFGLLQYPVFLRNRRYVTTFVTMVENICIYIDRTEVAESSNDDFTCFQSTSFFHTKFDVGGRFYYLV